MLKISAPNYDQLGNPVNGPAIPPPYDQHEFQPDEINPNITPPLEEFNQRLMGEGMQIVEEPDGGYAVEIAPPIMESTKITAQKIADLHQMLSQLEQPNQSDPDQGFGFTEGLNDGMG